MASRRLLVALLATLLATIVGLGVGSRTARAEDEDLDSRQIRKVFRLGAYGAAAGAGTGLVLWPISGRVNVLFVGAGMGFVMGTLAGIYHVNHEHDPQNPFRSLGIAVPMPTGEGGASPVALTYEIRF